jgi:ABC-2 type transport system permease protein
VFWYAAQILTFEVIYKHTEKIGDWNIQEMRVFLGLLFVIDAIYMVIIHENIENLSEKVRKGDLDLLLAKPVNSQFMISLQKANTAILGNLILADLSYSMLAGCYLCYKIYFFCHCRYFHALRKFTISVVASL